MRQIVFDLETTGFRFDEGHRIVEIGALEMVRGAITGKTFHAYVNPQRSMPKGAYDVHGLSEAFLRDFPVFTDPKIAPAFLAFVGDAELVAHNGKGFDLPFLNDELRAAELPLIENDLIDTLLMARKKFPGSPASLDALCSRFGVDTKQRERDGHGALLDSRLLAEVYIELTGGAQAGLVFDDRTTSGGRKRKIEPAKKRTSPLASLVTESEKVAHASFLEELGPDAVWAKVKARTPAA